MIVEQRAQGIPLASPISGIIGSPHVPFPRVISFCFHPMQGLMLDCIVGPECHTFAMSLFNSECG